jgi:hypothetical protein
VLFISQECSAQWHHCPVEQAKRAAAVSFCDQRKRAARLLDPVDLLHVGR